MNELRAGHPFVAAWPGSHLHERCVQLDALQGSPLGAPVLNVGASSSSGVTADMLGEVQPRHDSALDSLTGARWAHLVEPLPVDLLGVCQASILLSKAAGFMGAALASACQRGHWIFLSEVG